MKIAVEASSLIRRKTGVGYYTERLIKEVARIDISSSYYLVYLAFFNRSVVKSEGFGANVVWRKVNYLPGKFYNALLRTPFGLPIDLLSGVRPNIFLFPNFARWPLLFTKKSVIVIYDTSYLDVPDATETTHFRLYLKWVVPRSIKKSSHIVVISQSVKNSIMYHYGVSPEKITVITPAIDHAIFTRASEEDIRRTTDVHGISKEYILYLGTLEPRKNVAGLIAAYRSLPLEMRNRFQLVLAGGSGWGSDAIEQEAGKVEGNQLVRTGYVEDRDIVALYSGASLFVYPSFYEGFGMPPLEAMACGAPVITSNNSSLPEVVGDAGLLIDPDNPTELADAMKRVLSDTQLAVKMRSDGLKQAKKFTWEKSAEELQALLKKVDAS